MNKYSLTFVFTALVLFTFAQKAIIRGKVTDLKTGEELPFVNVYVKTDVAKGTSTDFEGNYTLKLDAGSYDIVFSFVSYADKIVHLDVENGKTYEKNIAMSEDAQMMNEVEIVGEKKAAKTMAAFDREKMNSTNMIDGTSSEQMKKTGDNNAGQVIKRVTGVSVMDGKYVYVRGLGDRYTKTILNNMSIPGLDPDRNTVQLDIFPTKLIDNITVYKTFQPNLPGDFTGGLVNIQTKDFPSQKLFSFSAGLGYNTVTTFNPNYISYNGGKLDALGIDDGTRKMPFSGDKPIVDPAVGDSKLTTLTKSFSPIMAVEKTKNAPNQNFSIGFGNQYNFDEKKIDYGYNFFLNYRNTYQYYDNVQYNVYRKEPDTTLTELYADRKSAGQLGVQNVLWSALLGQSIKINKKHKIALNLFHTQNGESRAASLVQENIEENPATLVKQSLQYTQRSISNLNLTGKHTLNNKWQVRWIFAPSLSKIQNPDIRSTVLERIATDSGYVYGLNASVGSEIRRIYRKLDEYNINSRMDFEYEFKVKNDLKSQLKFGWAENFKSRKYRIYDFLFDVENITNIPNDPNWFFQDENIWTPETDKGTYVSGNRQLANSYDATQMVLAGYVMNEFPISERFKTVYGARIEKVTNKYTGQNNDGSVVYNDTVVLDNTNILPAVNFVYVLKDSAFNIMNLRGSYTQTLARPSFKEKSIAQIYDPIQGRTFNGNINLKQTLIHNADARWEYFYGRTEVFSASVFYKKFINPIEIVSFSTAPNNIKPINSGQADVYGFELEARKRLGFKEDDHLKLYVGANYTYIQSRVDMNKVYISEEDKTEKQIREANARVGEKIANYRPLYGQSPYIVNAFTSFSNDSLGVDVNVSYNVQGKTLSVLGIGALPDVYTNPFHSLNFKASKTFGKEGKWKASFTARNLLNSKIIRYYESYKSKKQIYDIYQRGRTFSVTIGYTL